MKIENGGVPLEVYNSLVRYKIAVEKYDAYLAMKDRLDAISPSTELGRKRAIKRQGHLTKLEGETYKRLNVLVNEIQNWKRK